MKLQNSTNDAFQEIFNKGAIKGELLVHPSFQYLLDRAIQRRTKEVAQIQISYGTKNSSGDE